MNTDELKRLLEERTQEEWKAEYEDRSGYWIASWDSSGDGGFWETDAKLMALAPKLAERVIELEEKLALAYCRGKMTEDERNKMKHLDKPEKMLDTWGKLSTATHVERLYHAAYWQQQRDAGYAVEVCPNGPPCNDTSWNDDFLYTDTRSLYRLKPEYQPLEPIELKGMEVRHPDWVDANTWRRVSTLFKGYVAVGRFHISMQELMEQGYRFRKEGESGEGKLCRKEVKGD